MSRQARSNQEASHFGPQAHGDEGLVDEVGGWGAFNAEDDD